MFSHADEWPRFWLTRIQNKIIEFLTFLKFSLKLSFIFQVF